MASRNLLVVVVAYGHPDELTRCLQALRRLHPAIVIDNSSSPACKSAAEQFGATYVDPGRNLGFAAAVNLGLAHSAGHDVLLLNPDAIIEAEALSRLWQRMHRPGNERAAAVAPRQHGDDPDTELRVQWPFPSPIGTWADALGLGRLLARWSFLVGAVLLLRREAIDEVGFFDERFFLYAEEADWQWRAHRLGWQVILDEDVVAYHAGGATSSDPVVREVLFNSSFELLMRKWYGVLGWKSARAASLLGALARAAVYRGEPRRRALLRARLYLRGPVRAASALVGADGSVP